MANPSIDDTNYELRIKWTMHGQILYNVLNFKGRGVQDLVDNLITPVLTCIQENLLPVLTTEIVLAGADVRNTSGSVAQEATVSLIGDNEGTTASEGLPTIDAAVVKLKTTHPGRTGRGRMFLPGIPELHQHNSLVDATFVAAAVAFLACMATAFINSDPLATPFFHWCVRSRKDNQMYPISSTSVNLVIGSLRSRKVK